MPYDVVDAMPSGIIVPTVNTVIKGVRLSLVQTFLYDIKVVVKIVVLIHPYESI